MVECFHIDQIKATVMQAKRDFICAKIKNEVLYFDSDDFDLDKIIGFSLHLKKQGKPIETQVKKNTYWW